jgi:DNA-binding NarL/FixJ family response regulator
MFLTADRSFQVTTKRVKVAIIDDHPLFARMLADLISDQKGYEVVGVAHSGTSGLHMALHVKPDVIVLDLSMPGSNGLSVLHELRGALAKLRVLIFSANLLPEPVKEALRLGSEGILEKTASIEEFLRALELVGRGKTYMGEAASHILREMILSGLKSPLLTSDEIKILHMTLEGLKTKQIAASVRMSSAMVYSTMSKIRHKLGSSSIHDLSLMAFRRGFALTGRSGDCSDPDL